MQDTFNSIRRTWLQRLLAATLLFLSGMTGPWAMSRPPDVKGIYRFKGDVRVNGRQVQKGTLIRPGDTVTTGPNSSTIFVVGKDAFNMRERSRVKISGDGLIVKGLRLLTGGILSVFGPGEKQLQTVTATIGIRGTAGYLESTEEKTYICICYGKAELSAASGKLLETVTTQHHDSPRHIYPGAGGRIEKAPVINHTDAELIELESLVGREPPFLDDYSDYEY